MKFLLVLLVLVIYSCSAEQNNPETSRNWESKKIIGPTEYMSEPLKDSIYFNIDSIKKKCIPSSVLKVYCIDMDSALRKSDRETLERTGRLVRNSTEITNFIEIRDEEAEALFFNLLCRDFFIHEDYGVARTEHYSDILDTINFIHSYSSNWYFYYFETDSLFFFTTAEYEIGYLCPTYLFILDKFTGRLLNLTHVGRDIELATQKENIGKSVVTNWSDTLDRESAYGSMLWRDTFQIVTSIQNNGTIKWKLNFAKDMLLHDSMD